MTELKCEKCDKLFTSQDALQMHTSAKHPEAYKEPFFTKKRKRLFIRLGVVALLILAIATFSYSKSVALKDAPIIEVLPKSISLGSVSLAEGVASTTATITNNGNSALVLDSMETSCMCTSAAIVAPDGAQSPVFGMAAHGSNPANWQQVIPPGTSVALKIFYNPAVHPELRGQVTRSVFIRSNDPRNKVSEVRIDAYQTA